MDGEGGAFLIFMGNFSQDSHDFSQRWEKMRDFWEKRGLYLFYLPPYSPELNPAEILWRILKGKWIRPIDYETTDSLFYCTNMALASVGTNLFVNYSSYL